MKLVSYFALLSSLVSSAMSVFYIVPGAIWYDTSGARIQAHGGHVVKVGSTFYWLGYSNAAGVSPNIYTSTDLMNWSYYGLAAPSVTGMYRPKFVQSGGVWYILGQIDRNVVTLVGPTSSSPASTSYAVTGSPETLPPDARTFSDMGVFSDSNGDNYIITSADSNNIQINLINEGSPISVGSRVADLVDGPLEAPGMFKDTSGTYYLVMSAKTGWTANPNVFYYASSISGSWLGGTEIAPASNNTYNSQNSAELVISGSSTTTYIFLGDVWDSTGSDNSNYEWLPMSVSTSVHTVTLEDYSMWAVNPTTGALMTSFSNTTLYTADGIFNGESAVINKFESSSNVTFTNVQGSDSGRTWVSFLYTVSNVTAGETHASVNVGSSINLSDLNSCAEHHYMVPIALELNKGDNTLTFGVTANDGQEFSVQFDGIQVFDKY